MDELKKQNVTLILKSKKRFFIYKIIVLLVFSGLGFLEEIKAQDFWQQTNGPFGGLIPAVIVSKDGHILAGSDGGGIFRSTDNGDNWIFSGLANSSIQSFAVDTNGYIYAGNSGGIFRSNDEGINWTQVNNGLTQTHVLCMVVSVNNHIFVGTGGGGVFRSIDHGANWVQINNNLTNTKILSLERNMNGHIFAGTEGGGVFKSIDNGANWEQINSGLIGLEVLSLFVKPTNEYIFAGTYNGVFRSIDNGDNWVQVNNGLTSTDILALTVNQAGDIIASTSEGVFRSNNDGNNWVEISSGFAVSMHLKSFTVKEGSIIFAGSSNGVYRTTDGGNTWLQRNNGLAGSIINSIISNKSGEIFTGTEGGGVFRSFDKGITWEQVNSGLFNTYVLSLAINSNDDIFAGTYGGVFRSTDNGNNWTEINTNLTSSDVYALAVNSFDLIFAGTDDGVFRSVNNGNSWEQINNGLERTDVNTLIINSANHIFAGCDSAGIFRSTDNGDNWALTNNGLSNTDILSFTINSNNFIFAGTYEGVFRSADNGDNWESANNGLSSTDILCLITDFQDHIFAGTYEGVFASYNEGNNWINVVLGLTNLDIFSLSIHPAGFLFAGTYGSGVFKSTERTCLAIPALISPQDGMTNVDFRPVLKWHAVEGAGSYEIHVDDDSTFNSLDWSFTDTDTVEQTGVLDVQKTYYWRVNAAHGVNTGFWSDVWSFITFSYPQTINLSSPSIPFPEHDNISTYIPEDYRIVGIPGRIDSDMNLDGILGGVHKTDWQAYWDNGVNSQNSDDYLVEFDGGGEFIFGSGRAFWIIKKGDLNINMVGVETANLNNNGEAEIQLHQGWNLITNPFDKSIPWWEIQQVNPITVPIYSYNSGWRDAPHFDPYKGYYFDNDSNLSVLRIPYTATLPKPVNIKNFDWEVGITLTTGIISESSTSFGASKEADTGRDQFDFRKPRGIGSIPSVYFFRPEWDDGYGIFATDFRPEISDIEKWTFSVTSSLQQKTTLTFSEIEKVPEQYEIYLLDKFRSVYLNLRDKSKYNFIPVTKVSNFVILVGSRELVLEELDKVMPTDFELGKNFPNPFNPVTVIPVELPIAAEIKLKIYDILGKEIFTLFAGQKDVGRHYFSWSGNNYSNQKVAAGVYLYKLEVNTGEIFVGKMVMIK